MMIPIYLLSEYSVVKMLNSTCGGAFTVLWILITSFSVIPSPLVEPRYFIPSVAIYLKNVLVSEAYTQALFKIYILIDVGLMLLMLGVFGNKMIW